MINLLKETWQFLKENKGIFTIPIAFLIISDLVLPDDPYLNFVMFFILSMVVNIGFVNQIKALKIEKTKETKIDDFFVGVGKYFSVLMSGIVISTLFSIFIVTVISWSMDLITKIDEKKLEQIQTIRKNIVTKKTTDEITNYILSVDPEIQKIFFIWMIGVSILILILSILYFFTALWVNVAIIKDFSFLESCKKSVKIVFRNFGSYTFFVALNSLYFFLLLVLKTVSNDNFLVILLDIILNIYVGTYFSILYFLFVFKYLEGEEKNGLQSALSQIQKPDSEK